MSDSSGVDAGYFERLFAESDDPWAFKSRWYESRKRALTLACLPAARYASAYEPGCANGELSAALAARCDALRISDGNGRAVALARRRVAALSHVRVDQAWMPQDWPVESFDLIVLSEIGYFLAGDALLALADRARASLREGGTIVACHWRPRIDSCAFGGDAVHEILHRQFGLPRIGRWIDDDMLLDIWCTASASVGDREGLHSG